MVFEKDDRAGGLLRYGIPDFKLEKSVLDVRLSQLEAEGVQVRTSIDVGVDVRVDELRSEFDAVCIATGAGTARDLNVPGRELDGIHLAMDFLTLQNRKLAGDVDSRININARDRNVIIIGGGDTGSDCAGTCIRQGAKSVRQFELLPPPPVDRAASTPWPLWPMQLRTSHAHEEGCDREWSVATTAFSGENGRVQRIHAVKLEMQRSTDGSTKYSQQTDSAFEIGADLVLLAMGFTGPVKSRLLADLSVELDSRGNIAADGAHHSSVD